MEWLIKFTIITLPFMKVVGGVNISLADIFLVCLLIAILIKKSYIIPKILTDILKFQVMFLVVISSSMFINLVSTDFIKYKSFLYVFKLIICFLYMDVIIYVLNKKKKEKIKKYINLFGNVTFILSVLSVISYFLYNLFKYSTEMMYANRVRGFFEDPNLFCAYLFIGLGFILKQEKNKYKNIKIGIVIIAILTTGSRGGLVVLGVLTMYCISKLELKNKIKVILLVTLLISIGYKSGFFDVLVTRTNNLADGGDIRFKLWGIAINLIKLNPIFGVGIGNFMIAANTVLNSNIGNLVHNTYLSILVENGTLAFGVFISMYCWIWNNIRKNYSKKVPLGNLVVIIAIVFFAISINLENFRIIWFAVGVLFIESIKYNAESEKKNE